MNGNFLLSHGYLYLCSCLCLASGQERILGGSLFILMLQCNARCKKEINALQI